MKELTIEQKAKAYNEAFRIAQELYNDPNSSNVGKGYVCTVFPEVKESDDENIRKWIIAQLELKLDVNNPHDLELMILKSIAWLEKQGQEPRKVSIWKHWKDGICGNGEGKLIYLIKNGDDYSLSSILGFECDYIELSELDNLMLEKQGEQKPIEEVNGEDYGIDGLWHAQRILEETLGSVDGYQTDDGILDHKAAITAVKKLYKQKPTAWSEGDEELMKWSINNLTELKDRYGEGYSKVCDCIEWLKSIKQKIKGE